jgi:7-cyano-7-deazaguanine synthase
MELSDQGELMRPRAVVLLSGGLDSMTTLALAQSRGFDAFALSFLYGQRHRIEIEAATRVASAAAVKEHKIATIDLRLFGGSALTSDIPVPRRKAESDTNAAIPVTYVPARNTIFLSYAVAWAEVLGAGHVFIGVNAVDYSGYPDCRPEFISAYQAMARLATKAGVEGVPLTVHAPLIHMSKAEIIRAGLQLGCNYGLTLSCYDPLNSGEACGECDSCRIRLAAFEEVGVPDPARYQKVPA